MLFDGVVNGVGIRINLIEVYINYVILFISGIYLGGVIEVFSLIFILNVI